MLLGVAPFPHVLGQQVFVSAFLVGAGVSVMQRFEPDPALETMTATRTTVMFGVPTMCIALCEAARSAETLPSLRIAHVGGSAVPVDVARRFEETFGAALHEGYGLTEMSGLATTFALGRRRKASSVGRPSSGTEMRIANPDERVGRFSSAAPPPSAAIGATRRRPSPRSTRTPGSRRVISATSTTTATSSSSIARRR